MNEQGAGREAEGRGMGREITDQKANNSCSMAAQLLPRFAPLSSLPASPPNCLLLKKAAAPTPPSAAPSSAKMASRRLGAWNMV